MGVRTLAAPPGSVGIDEPWIPRKKPLRPNTHFGRGCDAHVVEKNVRPVDQLQENLHSLIAFEIQRDPSLIAVIVFEIIVVAAQSSHGADDQERFRALAESAWGVFTVGTSIPIAL